MTADRTGGGPDTHVSVDSRPPAATASGEHTSGSTSTYPTHVRAAESECGIHTGEVGNAPAVVSPVQGEAVETPTERVPLESYTITTECRANRGDEGAWREAVARLRPVYDAQVQRFGPAAVYRIEFHREPAPGIPKYVYDAARSVAGSPSGEAVETAPSQSKVCANCGHWYAEHHQHTELHECHYNWHSQCQCDRFIADEPVAGSPVHEGEDEPHCVTCRCGRRAPVQRGHLGGERHGVKYEPHGAGTISWAEHEQAWAVYDARYGGQSAERIAERGGFSYGELVEFLRREPTTWRARS